MRMRTWPRRMMKRAGGICLLLGILFSAFGCTDTVSPDRAFSYAEQDFSFAVSGSMTRLSPDGYTGTPALVGESLHGVPRPFSAVVSRTTAADGTLTATVTYTAPSALAGMVITCVTNATGEKNTVTATLTRPTEDGQTIRFDLTPSASEPSSTPSTPSTPPTVADSLLMPLSMLLPRGNVHEISPVTDGIFTISRTDADGTTTFTFTEGNPTPTRVTRKTANRESEMTVRPTA